MSVLQASGRHRHYGETRAEFSRWRRFIFRQQFHQRREEKEEEGEKEEEEGKAGEKEKGEERQEGEASEKWLGHIGRALVWECLSLFVG